MLHISMSFALLALAAGVFLHLKVKAENGGLLARLASWIIILFSVAMLTFDLIHHFTGHGHDMHGCQGMECCRPGMCGPEGGSDGKCCDMDMKSGGKMHDGSGDEHEGHDEHHEHGEPADTLK